ISTDSIRVTLTVRRSSRTEKAAAAIQPAVPPPTPTTSRIACSLTGSVSHLPRRQAMADRCRCAGKGIGGCGGLCPSLRREGHDRPPPLPPSARDPRLPLLLDRPPLLDDRPDVDGDR